MPPSRVHFAKQLGGRIASIRLSRSLTQERCAWESGMSKAYLSQIEAGKRIPSLPILLQLAERLDVTLGELFDFPSRR